MTTVKSLEDLKRIREEALQKRQLKNEPGRVQIIVGMGTPGIAAGVRETMKTILEYIETHDLQDTIVRQTGNIGMDSWEPIIQVAVGDQPKVTYGNVDPAAAERIMAEHVVGGIVVQDYLIVSP
jgi:NADP-reducing hydrogenase subunit HndB